MKRALTALALLGGVLFAAPAQACFVHATQPVWVWLDEVQVDITGVVAKKTYNCVFKNPNSAAVVGGTCYMELEPGAQIDGLTVEVDGKEYKAEVLTKKKANEVFQQIVKDGGSPALLEYFGNQLVQTQLPKIAPGGVVTVKLRYTQLLRPKDGLIRLQTLNTNPKAEKKALQAAAVTVRIKTDDPIKTVYSPTHDLKFEEEEGWDTVAKWSEKNYLPKHPFVMYIQTDPRPLGASLMAYRELGEDGHFLLMLSPGVGSKSVPEEKILPKDVVFCIDTSGSMLQDDRLKQAKEALSYCVKTLHKEDRFSIVSFGTRVGSWPESGFREATEENLAAAKQEIDDLHARGGTRMEPALRACLDKLSAGDRLKLIVFFTDGKPTLGERDPKKVLASIRTSNDEGVRLFVFGGGYDVNARLLDLLALQNRGEADYVLPEEDLSTKISGFFDRIGSPLMSDLEVSGAGIELVDVYPKQIPDVFAGEPVIVMGRYRGHGPKTITLKGTGSNGTQELEYELNFPEYSETDKEAFVPRLWAGAKVDAILNELRSSETLDEKQVEEVTNLARRYGIVTPYTAYLVRENVQGRPTPGPGVIPRPQPVPFAAGRALGGGGFGGVLKNRIQAESETADDLALDLGTRTANSAQEQLVQDAKSNSKLRRKNLRGGKLSGLDEAASEEIAKGAGYRDYAFSEPDASSAGDAEMPAERKAEFEKQKAAAEVAQLSTLRYVGNRTFYAGSENWYQSDYNFQKPPKTPRVVDVGSEEAMQMLDEDPRLAKYFALGNVLLTHRGEWIQINDPSRKKS